MAAVTASQSLQAAAAAPALARPQRALRPASVSRAFGVKPSVARVSLSLEEDVKAVAAKCANAGKAAAVALAASALLAAGPVEAVTKRLTFDEIQSLTYNEVKGSGTANQCPVLGDAQDGFKFGPGQYNMKKFCMEPTSFTVKAESQFKGEGEAYQKTKLMTRLTYTLDEMEGPFSVGPDGSITMKETDGIDYAAVTVQLPGGERVPFLFTVKELVATGKPEAFSGPFIVPSYRGSSFLDPKGRGGSTGYDNAVALPAGGAGDDEEIEKENTKNTAALQGNITLSVAKSNPSTGEIAGVFQSIQPSDTDLGSKVPKEVRIEGLWYAQLE